MRSRFLFPPAVVLLLACGSITPATIEYVDHSPSEPRLGEITTLRFRAMDSRGQPLAGVTMEFSLQSQLPGVTLDPTSASTDKQGIAQVQLLAAARVSSVVVIARAGDRIAVAPPIGFAGAGPSVRQFTFQCGPVAGPASGGIHAIGAYDETRHLIAGVKLNCTAHVGDRNGDGVPNAVVSFLTEAGTIGPSETSETDVIGDATVLYKTSLPFPKDVDPGVFSFTPPNDTTHTGQLLVPLWMHPFDWKRNPITDYSLPPDRNEPRRLDPVRSTTTGPCPPTFGPLCNNPRDNLVTMVAVTSGEEAFTDLNNNGRWDDNEPYEDLTEPFVDSNDNGTWDSDERWVDTNGDGLWNGKNGKYDGNTLIWVQERILWTGIPHPRDVADPISPVFRQLTPSPNVPHFGSAPVSFLISDPWFNTMAQNGDNDGCGVADSGAKSVVLPNPKAIGWQGVRLTYPAYVLGDLALVDAHDPLKTPPEPPYSSPIGFVQEVVCQFTSSPISGYVLSFATPGITGTVQ